MPYIDPKIRAKFFVDGYAGSQCNTTGELNFVITRALTSYLLRYGVSYNTINDIIGALEGAKLEFYRRIAAPYEDKKKEENGDVY